MQARILALADHPEHASVREFQILQKHPLELTAPVRIGRSGTDVLQGQAQVAFERLRPKGLWPSEVTLSQTFDLPDTELFAAQGRDELVDVGRRV